MYRHYDCNSNKNHVTVLEVDADPMNGQSCHETSVVTGVKGMKPLVNGSILLGRGDVPAAVAFTLPTLSPVTRSMATSS
jgi:hypothetical protein